MISSSRGIFLSLIRPALRSTNADIHEEKGPDWTVLLSFWRASHLSEGHIVSVRRLRIRIRAIIPRQQLVYLVDLVICDTFQHPGEPCLCIDAVQHDSSVGDVSTAPFNSEVQSKPLLSDRKNGGVFGSSIDMLMAGNRPAKTRIPMALSR